MRGTARRNKRSKNGEKTGQGARSRRIATPEHARGGAKSAASLESASIPV